MSGILGQIIDSIHDALRRLFPTGELEKFELKPGAWYYHYLGDYLTDHPGEEYVHSAVVQLPGGKVVWATNTPEWDQEWFEDYGYEFPDQWIVFDSLKGIKGTGEATPPTPGV